MLYKETIDTWFGVGAPRATVAVLNTDRINTLQARGSGSSFNYSLFDRDRRAKPTLVWGDTAASAIRASFDTSLSSQVMTLNVYPNNDITATPVAKYIRYKDFVYAYAYEGDSTKSWVVLPDVRGVVNSSLDELVEAAEPSFTDEYQAVYDKLVELGDTPSDTVAAADNQFVIDLKAANIWQTRDIIYFLAQETNVGGGAQINWVNIGTYDATLQGTPAFTALEGFAGSSGNYIKTGYTPSTHAVKSTLDSTSHGGYTADNPTLDAVEIMYGVYDDDPATLTYMLPSLSDDVDACVNGTSAAQEYKQNYKGYYGASRNTSSEVRLYVNYKKHIDSSNSSVALPPRELYLLCRNLNGSATNYFTKKLGFFHIGAKLTDEQTFALVTALKARATAVDKNVLGENIGVIGDSISDATGYTYVWPTVPDEIDYITTNYADIGDTIASNLATQVALMTGDVYDKIVLFLGTNDNNGGNMTTLQSTLETQIAALKSENPSADIYYVNVLPRWTDVGGGTEVDKGNIRTAIAAACTVQGITCWDTYTTPWIEASDTNEGLHPSEAGQIKVWGKINSRL